MCSVSVALLYGEKEEQVSKLYTEYTNLITAYWTKVKEEKQRLLGKSTEDKRKEESQPTSCWSCFQRKKKEKESATDYDKFNLEEFRPLILETANKLYEATRCKGGGNFSDLSRR
jgi:hypothetical protein